MIFINDFTSLLSALESASGQRLIIAVDGRPCCGKTTLAMKLSEALQAEILHLDDFFIPQKFWSKGIKSGFPFPYFRYNEFIKGVQTLACGKSFTYFDYDWEQNDLSISAKTVRASKILIVEGVSALNPQLIEFYSKRIWVASDPNTELETVIARESKSCINLWKSLYLPSVDLYLKSKPWLRADIIYAGPGITNKQDLKLLLS